jgi:hypothetical protein
MLPKGDAIMSGDSKQEFRDAIQPRYSEASREEKGLILREFCAVCKYHRKYAIRLLNQRKRGPTKRPGRKPLYHSPEFLGALKRIWLATDQMCSKKLVAAIPLWLPFYEGAYGKLSARTTDQLLSISAATIDRLLAKPGSLLRNQIPIRTHNWDISQPGFMEADTVAHCGNSLAGDFIWSLTLTDIHTGWTDARATWNNGATGVIEQIKNIETDLPFELKGFDCTLPSTNQKLSSPDRDPIRKTTTHTSNKKTGPMSDICSDTTDSTTTNWSNSSTTSTPNNGAYCKTTSAQLTNS